MWQDTMALLGSLRPKRWPVASSSQLWLEMESGSGAPLSGGFAPISDARCVVCAMDPAWSDAYPVIAITRRA
jgi:hypothetical protein